MTLLQSDGYEFSKHTSKSTEKIKALTITQEINWRLQSRDYGSDLTQLHSMFFISADEAASIFIFSTNFPL
jgi:hypothetical protein